MICLCPASESSITGAIVLLLGINEYLRTSLIPPPLVVHLHLGQTTIQTYSYCLEFTISVVSFLHVVLGARRNGLRYERTNKPCIEFEVYLDYTGITIGRRNRNEKTQREKKNGGTCHSQVSTQLNMHTAVLYSYYCRSHLFIFV